MHLVCADQDASADETAYFTFPQGKLMNIANQDAGLPTELCRMLCSREDALPIVVGQWLIIRLHRTCIADPHTPPSFDCVGVPRQPSSCVIVSYEKTCSSHQLCSSVHPRRSYLVVIKYFSDRMNGLHKDDAASINSPSNATEGSQDQIISHQRASSQRSTPRRQMCVPPPIPRHQKGEA